MPWNTTRGWVVPSTTQAFSLTVDLTGEGTASQEASLLAGGGCGCFRGFLKSKAVFKKLITINDETEIHGETLVTLFWCDFMLISAIFSVALGKLPHFATDTAPH